jgi:hypothetical protein
MQAYLPAPRIRIPNNPRITFHMPDELKDMASPRRHHVRRWTRPRKAKPVRGEIEPWLDRAEYPQR